MDDILEEVQVAGPNPPQVRSQCAIALLLLSLQAQAASHVLLYMPNSQH